jgi:hypothetical protein
MYFVWKSDWSALAEAAVARSSETLTLLDNAVDDHNLYESLEAPTHLGDVVFADSYESTTWPQKKRFQFLSLQPCSVHSVTGNLVFSSSANLSFSIFKLSILFSRIFTVAALLSFSALYLMANKQSWHNVSVAWYQVQTTTHSRFRILNFSRSMGGCGAAATGWLVPPIPVDLHPWSESGRYKPASTSDG